KPEYQNKGVNAMLFADLFPRLKDMGFKAAESNAELESNVKVQSQWQGLEWEQHKRRRIYGKSI
ncbi:MAG: N-acetyltransferase, partial [Bacteroidales bacterium]|nr:N-acetyltransferase [Bacteroidales bacterium]